MSANFKAGRPRRDDSYARSTYPGTASEAVARPTAPNTLRRVASDRLRLGSLPVVVARRLGRFERLSVLLRCSRREHRPVSY